MNGRVIAIVVIFAVASGCAPRNDTRLVLTARGHQELTAEHTPWFIGTHVKASVCVTPSLQTDTSRWRGRVLFASDAATNEYRAPAVRAGATLCFDGHTPVPGDASALCLELVDDSGVAPAAGDCVPIHATTDDADYEELLRERRAVLAGDDAQIVARSLALATEAQTQGFVVTALRLTLVAAHFARGAGSAADQRHVAARLDIRPLWVGEPSAHSISGQYFYEQAMGALMHNDLPSAWSASGRALRHFDAIADPKAIVVHTRRAQIIDRAGAPTEARQRLGRAISNCDQWPCDPGLLRDAQNSLAWWLMQDPDADAAALAEAGQLLRKAGVSVNGVEHANVLLNYAYLNTRQRDGNTSSLNMAEQILDALPGRRAGQLRQWSMLIRAQSAAADGDFARVLSLSESLVDGAELPSLAAQVHSVRAQALRATGRLTAAANQWEAAIARHRQSDTLDQWLPLSPGRQAQDYFWLALTAIDLGEPEAAWRWLERLDRASSDACRGAATTEQAADAVATALDRAERAPASRERQDQRARTHAKIRQRQTDRVRQRGVCHSTANIAATVAWRAFAADDQILLLTRSDDGQIRLAQRTTMPRAQLLAQTTRLDQMLNDAGVEDSDWRAAAAPFATALVPRDLSAIGPVTRVALHGYLQRVPLAALPVGTGWLSQHTVVLMATGPGQPHAPRAPGSIGVPQPGVFVVDPVGNLPSGRQAAAFYRDVFPDATVLHERAATVAAVREALNKARWLHIDAHGELDEEFVELFALRMADGALSSGALVDNASELWLANLSGCLSARWSLTADSGQWGLAGRLARAGARWVIGSRSQLDDAAADQFNRTFYEHYRAGVSVHAAYGRGLETLQARYPAAIWAGLLLMGGQSDNTMTPTSIAQPVT